MTSLNMPISNPITPGRTTRFYGSADFVLDVIENKQVAFVHASMLNDPFDPYGFFETDFGDDYQNLLKHVQKHHSTDLTWFKESVTAQSWAQMVIDIKAYQRRFRETTFVLSTCAETSDVRPENNLYMWGHYAKGHRGVAIEFSTLALANAVRSHNEATTGKPVDETNVWARMEYSKTFPPITAEQIYRFMKQEMELSKGIRIARVPTQLEIYYHRMSTIKSDVWQSENEWRLMWRNDEIRDTVYKCPVGSDAVTNIFLGLIIAPEVRDKILVAAKRHFPFTPVLQAHKRHGDLGLTFLPT